jgi:hypothetical protein
MDHRHLGRTGLLVSPVALGTMNFCPVTPAVDAHAIMDWALDHGVTLFDTADVYGADANRTIADASPRNPHVPSGSSSATGRPCAQAGSCSRTGPARSTSAALDAMTPVVRALAG